MNYKEIIPKVLAIITINLLISLVLAVIYVIGKGLTPIDQVLLSVWFYGFILMGILQWLYVIPLLIVLAIKRKRTQLLGYFLGAIVMVLLALGGYYYIVSSLSS